MDLNQLLYRRLSQDNLLNGTLSKYADKPAIFNTEFPPDQQEGWNGKSQYPRISYYELFRQYVLVLYEHKEIESEINGCYEVIKFLAHLFRDEIKCFVERTEKALLIAKTKKFNLVGTLRNVQKEYAIVFTATEQIPSEKLLPVVFEKQKVHTLLQVITYWVNDNEYMIDFVLWQG